MVISLGPEGPVRANADGSRPLTSASNLMAVMSEIAAGRIALFSRPRTAGLVSVALATVARGANVDCRRVAASLRLSPDTLALCSSDFPLPSRTTTATILSPQFVSIVNARRAAGAAHGWAMNALTEGCGALRVGAEGETRTPTSFLTTP